MKMVNVPKLLILLLYLLVHKIIFPSHVSKLASLLKSYNKLVIFFAFNFLLMTIFFGYSKPSIEEFDFISLIVPSESLALYDDEKAKKEDDARNGSSDFVLRVDYIGWIDKTTEDGKYDGVISDIDGDDFHGYDGYDEENDIDYGSDYDDYGDDEKDEKDDDLKSRIEEFIAKNNRKWKEEHFSDKLALIKSC